MAYALFFVVVTVVDGISLLQVKDAPLALIVATVILAALMPVAQVRAAAWFTRAVLVLAGWATLWQVSFAALMWAKPPVTPDGLHAVMPLGQVFLAGAISVFGALGMLILYLRRGRPVAAKERLVARGLAMVFVAMGVWNVVR